MAQGDAPTFVHVGAPLPLLGVPLPTVGLVTMGVPDEGYGVPPPNPAIG